MGLPEKIEGGRSLGSIRLGQSELGTAQRRVSDKGFHRGLSLSETHDLNG